MTVTDLRELLAIMARTPANYATDTVLFIKAMDDLQEIIAILQRATFDDGKKVIES